MTTSTLRRGRLGRVAVSLLLAGASFASAQCPLAFEPIAPSPNGPVLAFVVLPDGDLVVGGNFSAVGTVAARSIARFDGTAWHALGSGVDGSMLSGGVGVVHALHVMPDGSLIVGGDFSDAGGVATNAVARWHGGTWSGLATGVQGIVHAVTSLPGGDVVVGGLLPAAGSLIVNHIARFDGSAWHALGAGVNTYWVEALATLPNGDLIAAGNFWQAGGVSANKIARWDGASWSPLGSGMQDGFLITVVNSLSVLPDGDLIAGGNFGTAGGVPASCIARWDGTRWHALGAGVTSPPMSLPTVRAMSVLPDGDLLVGGSFVLAGGVPVQNLARWDGAAWSDVAGGTGGAIHDLGACPDGSRLVAGSFATAGGLAIAGFARLVTPCPATASAYGAGCVGAAGPTALVAAHLPWLGGAFAATASGLPPGSLAVAVFGFGQQALPMPLVHPLGVAGCELLVTDEILITVVPAAGSVATAISIPDVAALVGAVFYHQVVPVELDGSGDLAALAATNALAVTIGDL